MNDPFGEVAHIDELNRILRRPGRKHFASAGKPCRPVSEAARRILRADNKTRPANEGAFTDGLLARDFGRAIDFFIAVLDLRQRWGPQWRCIRPLPGRTIVRIHAYRRDEGPMSGLPLECGDRAAHLARMT